MVWVSSLLSKGVVILSFLALSTVFIPALGRSEAGECFKHELPSFLVPFLAYFYYKLASHEVFPEEENVLTMPKQAFSSAW